MSMSAADLDLFGPPEDAVLHPTFTMALRGYDPEQVREYMTSASQRIEALEKELETVKASSETMRQRYSKAREDAYGQVATQLADLLRAADHQAAKLRREAEEDSHGRITDAQKRAENIRQTAEVYAERKRREGDEALKRAQAEVERVLGGLAVRRDVIVDELDIMKARLLAMADEMTETMTASKVAIRDGEAEREAGLQVHTPAPVNSEDDEDETDSLLGSNEGFDIVIPEFLLHEDSGEE